MLSLMALLTGHGFTDNKSPEAEAEAAEGKEQGLEAKAKEPYFRTPWIYGGIRDGVEL